MTTLCPGIYIQRILTFTISERMVEPTEYIDKERNNKIYCKDSADITSEADKSYRKAGKLETQECRQFSCSLSPKT